MGPMNIFKKESTWDKVRKPLGKAASGSVARSGLTAGATLVALSVVSAATSAARRRKEGP
jgi:hypothetical protein